jgi:hypothetical protein
MNRNKGGCGSPLWNLGTLYFVVSTVCLLSGFVMVFMNPEASIAGFPLNPWPNAPERVVPTYTLIPTLPPPPSNTPEPTALIEFPTEDPNNQVTPTNTLPPLPSDTPLVFPSLTPTESGDTGGELYVVQDGTPLYMPGPTCDTMWVAGTVSDAADAPVIFIEVRLGGVFGEESGFSGTAEQYGDSGWEIDLGKAPQDSIASAFVQLYNVDTESQVSDILIFNTFNDCTKNLIMINFVTP